jgi:alkanesulfonate monooxygenase SsuD/methylene tetrahydromethanopterin reductase-like flavin-dependent oxidoreductase (luciferase family)
MGIQAATLQDLSGGRLLLGLGVSNKTIARWHGGTFDRPLRRIREYVEIVRKVAAGERVEYQGQIYDTGRRFQLSWKPEHPRFPIYVAALGPKMTRLTGEIAEGVVINMAPASQIREIVSRVREGAAAAGRDPARVEVIAKVWASWNPDRNLARRGLRQFLTFYCVADHYFEMLTAAGLGAEVTRAREAFQQGGFKAAQAQITDAFMDQMPAIAATSIEEIKERLQPYEGTGITRLVIPYVPATDSSVDDARRFIEAWGSHS